MEISNGYYKVSYLHYKTKLQQTKNYYKIVYWVYGS